MKGTTQLYVDALNFSSQFGFVRKAFSIHVPKREIENFVKACRTSGWEPIVFIDAGIESDEALAKWKSRRRAEVLDCIRSTPYGMSSIMGDIFRLFGVKVYYSPWNADNDDCIAYYAHHADAAVLSNDIDFARYVDKKYLQFGTFKIEDGKVILTPKKIDERRLPAPRNILSKAPVMVESEPGFVYLSEKAQYVRGSPSFATKFYGNFHQHVTKLRHYLYRHMELERVEESWPEYEPAWYEDGLLGVVWVKSIYDSLQDVNVEDYGALPIETIYHETRKVIFGPVLDVPNFTNDEKWNLEITIMLMIAELYAAIINRTSKIQTTMLEQVLLLYNSTPDVKFWISEWKPAWEDEVPSVCRNWKTDGVCNFGDRCFAKSGHFVCDCWRGETCPFRHDK